MCEKNPTRFEIAQGLATTLVRQVLDKIEPHATAELDNAVIDAQEDLIEPILLAMKAQELLEISKLLDEIAGWAKVDSERTRDLAANGVYFEAAKKSAICEGYQRVVLLIQRQFRLEA